MHILIAAIDKKRGIAKGGVQPWSIPDDEKFFTEQTKSGGGNILVGGTTFRGSLGGKPLAGRNNFLLTRSQNPIEGVTVVNNLEKFLHEFNEDLWVIGGAEIYQQVIDLGFADELVLTEIEADFACDQFFPDYSGYKLAEESETHCENGFEFRYKRYTR